MQSTTQQAYNQNIKLPGKTHNAIEHSLEDLNLKYTSFECAFVLTIPAHLLLDVSDVVYCLVQLIDLSTMHD